MQNFWLGRFPEMHSASHHCLTKQSLKTLPQTMAILPPKLCPTRGFALGIPLAHPSQLLPCQRVISGILKRDRQSVECFMGKGKVWGKDRQEDSLYLKWARPCWLLLHLSFHSCISTSPTSCQYRDIMNKSGGDKFKSLGRHGQTKDSQPLWEDPIPEPPF